MSNQDYPRAVAAASKIIKDFGITNPTHIEIEKIADAHNAFVKEELIEGSSARLTRYDSVAIITVNEKIREPGQKRFAIAHELGHFLLHKSTNQLENCTEQMFLDWYKTRIEEPESNAFAAEILMPSHIFKAYCKEKMPNFDEIRELANTFKTTITATALKYIDHTPHPCVLVVSENKKVKWLRWRFDFPYRIISRGTQISEHCCANDFFTKGVVPEKPEPMTGDAWLENWRSGHDIILYEHAFALPYYGAVLSLIWTQ